MTSELIRIAVCDDSRTYSHALRRFLEHDGDIEVTGVYGTAEELLRHLTADRPDLVTMDLELPGLDGVAATERIMRERPVPVVVLSAHVGRGSERAAAALAAGAVEAISKADLKLTDAEGTAAVAVRRRLKRLSRARVGPAARAAPATAAVRPARRRRPHTGTVRAVGLAASTGGPQALAVVIRALPEGFPIPVLVVQHMAVGFTTGLTAWLGRQTELPVRVARAGDRATGPGIWFAPDEAHLVVDRRLGLGLDRRTGGRHVPSADVLFTSMARALGADAATVVLTGLGADGAAGTAAVVAAGGLTFAQDAASSVVDGMPKSARDAGAEIVVALGDVAPSLAALVPKAGP